MPTVRFLESSGVSDGCPHALGGGMAGREGTLNPGLHTLANGKCPLEEVAESTGIFK